MPVFSLIPKDSAVEARMMKKRHELRSGFKEDVRSTIGWPENDVLVDLLRCPYLDADPASADLRVIVETCPHEQLESLSNGLCDKITDRLIGMGFSTGMGGEAWIQFVAGPWRQFKDGVVIDFVNHPREKEPEDESSEKPDDRVYADRDYFPN